MLLEPRSAPESVSHDLTMQADSANLQFRIVVCVHGYESLHQQLLLLLLVLSAGGEAGRELF